VFFKPSCLCVFLLVNALLLVENGIINLSIYMLNPILIKELRIQMRSWKYYAVGTIYILTISGLVFGMIWEASTSKKTLDPEYGKRIFFAFFVVLTLAVCMICPAFTVGAISSEEELLSFDLVRITLLKPRHILSGKLAPVLIYALILLFASLPATLLIMPVSGTSLMEISLCYLIAFISATMFSLIGFMWSSIFRRTRIAAIVAYITTGVFAFGTMVVPTMLSRIFQVRISHILLSLCNALNPFYVIASKLEGAEKATELITNLIISYLIISVIVTLVILLRLRRTPA